MGHVRKVSRRRLVAVPALVLAVATPCALLLWAILGASAPERGPRTAPGRATQVAQAEVPGALGALALPEPPAPPPEVAPDAEPEDVDLEAERVAPEEQDDLVVLQGDRPASGLRVRAWRRGLEGGRALAEGLTDAQGVLRLSPRVDGPLTLVVDAGARQVAVQDGFLDLEASELLAGTVLGPRDEGVPAELTVWLGALPLARTRADPGGAFHLEWVPVEGAVLEASAEGYLPARTPLGRNGQEKLELRLRAGSSGWLAGQVLDGRGLPVEGALVRLLRGERAPLLAASDAAGRFAFERLEAGAVTLEALRPGESIPAVRTDARVAEGELTQVTIPLEPPARLTVRLRGAEGPLAGWKVRLVDPSVSRYGGYSESLAQPEQTSDADGQARFAGLPPGRYYVRADRPDTRDGSLLAEVELRPGEESQVTLTPSERQLRVRVVDREGRPVRGIYMDVSMPGINWRGMPSATSDADGLATFEQLPPGLAEVHLGRGNLWRMLRSEEQEASFTWTEQGSLRLDGRVQGYEGEALVVCVLPDVAHMTRTRLPAGGRLELTVTPPQGRCEVFLLARDRRLAPVALGSSDGSSPLLFEASFEPGAGVRGRLVDAASGRGVPGRVLLPGALAAALEAHTQWLGGTDHDEWITVNEWSRASGPDGRFELAGLPVGPLRLDLQALGEAPRLAAFDPLGASEERDLGDVPLQPR